MPLWIGAIVLEYPRCPRCGESGAKVTLVGKQDRGGVVQDDGRRLGMLYAYQCQCGLTFTHALWDERTANSSLRTPE